MCTGAIINSRVKTLYYGAPDPKAGSCGTLVNLFELPYNHRPEVVSGLLEAECAGLLRDFFQSLRARKKAEHLRRVTVLQDGEALRNRQKRV